MIDSNAAVETQPARPGRKLLLSEGLALAVLPVVAYLLTYSHETAYFEFFGVPQNVVGLDFASLLETSALLTVVFILIAGFLFWVHPVWLLGLLAMATGIGAVYATYQTHQPLLIVAGVIALLGIVYFLVVWGKWLRQYRKNPSIGPPYKGISYDPASTGTLAIVARAFGIGAGTFVAIMFFFFVYALADAMAAYLGTQNAANTRWFLVNEQKPAELVLGRSGDRWVCAELESPSSNIIRSYSFRPMSSDSTTWQWRRLPALHPAHGLRDK